MLRTKRPANAFARKSCVIATELALALMAAPLAFAQTAERGERIEVTGTRIPSPNIESTSPVAVVTAQDIKLEGVTRIEDMLNSLPQVFADFGATISNGATGTATVNLRNLGATRTLVLMNGRRLPIGSPAPFTANYAPDLNQIPTPLINRVEVLTGGASAVYGSDAVAGVVNFIMRDNFEGVQGEINYSFYNHQQNSSQLADTLGVRASQNPAQFAVPGDISRTGDSSEANLLIGGNFANGKGNATVFFDYKKDKPVLQSQYNYSACATGTNAAGTAFTCGGSGTTGPGGQLINGVTGAAFTIANAQGGVRPYSSTLDAFNFAPYNYYQRPDERYGFAAFSHYDINSHARVYGEFNFHDSHTEAQIAPSGIFAFQEVFLTNDNPLLSQAFKDAMGITASTPGDVLIARRNIEGGGRIADLRHTSFRYVLGVKGDIFKNWDYDVYGQEAKVIYQQIYRNDFSIARITRALDVVADPTTGAPVCRSALDGTDPACAPYNIFALGGVNQAALDYLQTPGFANGFTAQRIAGATLSSDLGNYGWKLPSSKSGIGVALGIERRTEKLKSEFDTAFATGDLAGQGGPTNNIDGQYTVLDYFAELRVPIMENRPGVDMLSINGSYRYSDYSTDKSTDSYGIGIEYAPVKTVKLRGSYQQAVRAPNIVELFTAQGAGLFNMDTDPCGVGPAQPTPTASAAQCARSGLPANLYGTSLLISPAGQYTGNFGGNPVLDPETAKTYTFGIVLQPLRNLSATIDYFNIKVDKVIQAGIPGALIVQQCIFSNQFCDLIHRNAQRGTLWGQGLAQGFVEQTFLNGGSLKTSGVDVSLNYNYNLAQYGGLGLSFLGSYVRELINEPVPGLGEYDCAGYHGTTCGTPVPKWRHKLRAVWTTPWIFDLALTWRHLDSVKIDAASSDALLSGTVLPVTAEMGKRDYFDISGSVNLTKKITLRAGVNNLFDKDPPIGVTGAPFGNGNTYPQVYDSLGRKLFASLTVQF
jgi:outer membrane receptor protein involved in Fe transport